MIRTYKFYQTDRIHGIPGEFHTGQIVKVDTNTNTIVEKSMMEGVDISDDTPEEDEPTLPLDTTTSPKKKVSSQSTFGPIIV